MPLQKLIFKPGINREGTDYSNEGGWFNSNLVRFRKGLPEKIGGWAKNTINTFLSTGRALHPWVDLALTKFLGLGTTWKYYIQKGNVFNDITPIRKTSTNSITFSATNGSSTITATDSSHGAQINDFVTDFYDKNITKYDIKDYQSFEKKLIKEFKTLGIEDSATRKAIDTFGFPNVGKHPVKGTRGSSLPLNLYGMGARTPSGNVLQSDAQAFYKKTFYSAQLEKKPQLVKNLKRYLDYYNTDKKFYKGTYIDRVALKANYADVLDPKVQSDLLYLLESDEIGTGKLRGGFLKQYNFEIYI